MKDIKTVRYLVTDHNICIKGSCEVSKKDFRPFLLELREKYPNNSVLLNRSNRSLESEWAVHNFLYKIEAWKDHTKDVDLNYPRKWYVALGYGIFGPIAKLFIR